jgi:hypothetical protein
MSVVRFKVLHLSLLCIASEIASFLPSFSKLCRNNNNIVTLLWQNFLALFPLNFVALLICVTSHVIVSSQFPQTSDGTAVQLGHDSFLPHPFQIIIQHSSRYHSRSQETTTPSTVDWLEEISVSYVGAIQRIYISSDYFYSDSSMVQGFIRVEFL